MAYYNQNNYASVPYPSSAHPDATVKSGGCGVCCASMVVEELTGKKWPPNESAAYSISCGGRVAEGTDMIALAKALAVTYGLKVRQTKSIDDVLSAMQYSGAIVVANSKGGSAGLFSTGGHFIILRRIQSPYIVVWDPDLYAGKYDKSWRKGKAQVYGNEVYVLPATLDSDIRKDYSAYFIFTKGVQQVEPTIKDTAVKMGETQIPAKLIDGVTYVPLRAFVEAIKTELDVTWSAEAGAGVEL